MFRRQSDRGHSSSRSSQLTVDSEKTSTDVRSSVERGTLPTYEQEAYQYDPNFDFNSSGELALEEDSPYPEVRSAVANADDPLMPVSTIRSWTIGLTCAIITGALNQFLFFRYPSIVILGIVSMLISFPIGRAWAACAPHWSILGVSLNPGPFAIKEHVIISIMASLGTSAYGTNVIATQKVLYEQDHGFGYQWMLVMSMQLIGYSYGGIARRFLVTPPSMIWPANLVSCALFNTLHTQHYSGMGSRGGVSRERFFLYAFLISGAWYFFPGYLFTALSYFTWVCWIAPNNVPVNQMFGYVQGMGMSAITFDWSMIAYAQSPLVTPWWAEANIAIGFVVFYWILTPILYYTNVWNSKYLPLVSRSSYDNTGEVYDVSRILNADLTLNEDAYKAYSPVFMSATMAVAYGLSFATITATIVHTFLHYRKQIWGRSRHMLYEQPDIHARLMEAYPAVPSWWYALMFIGTFAMAVVTTQVWETKLPVQWLILALVISFVYLVPAGMIQAMTNQQIGLGVLAELIIGYALPGRPIALMLFKTFGYITMLQALFFTSDFKLGHYMKIPPRTMFWAQTITTVIVGTVQLGVQKWMFENVPDMCDPEQKDGLICASTEVFGTASIIWGVIGPRRQLSSGQIYYGLSFAFLGGAVLPVIFWYLMRRFPHGWIRYINVPVILTGTAYFPPASSVNYVSFVIVGFIFQYVIRRRHFSWWTKYNYVLSAALDASVAIASLLIYFCLQYPKHGTIGESTIENWWGNTVYLNTADAKRTPILPVPEVGTFGPATW